MQTAFTQAQLDALLKRMRTMSAADISVLEAAVNTPDSNLTTASGSNNDVLWSEMEQFGWIATRNEELDLPSGRRFTMKIYTISPEGRGPILSLLSALKH